MYREGQPRAPAAASHGRLPHPSWTAPPPAAPVRSRLAKHGPLAPSTAAAAGPPRQKARVLRAELLVVTLVMVLELQEEAGHEGGLLLFPGSHAVVLPICCRHLHQVLLTAVCGFVTLAHPGYPQAATQITYWKTVQAHVREHLSPTFIAFHCVFTAFSVPKTMTDRYRRSCPRTPTAVRPRRRRCGRWPGSRPSRSSGSSRASGPRRPSARQTTRLPTKNFLRGAPQLVLRASAMARQSRNSLRGTLAMPLQRAWRQRPEVAAGVHHARRLCFLPAGVPACAELEAAVAIRGGLLGVHIDLDIEGPEAEWEEAVGLTAAAKAAGLRVKVQLQNALGVEPWHAMASACCACILPLAAAKC